MAKYATVRQSAGAVPVGDKNGRADGQDVAPSTRGTEQRWIATLPDSTKERDSAGDRGGVGNVLSQGNDRVWARSLDKLRYTVRRYTRAS